MSRLGDTLRAQRERKGITLDQAAADTRIREKFLKALEDSDYHALPGTVYTRGFLRNYAEYLTLDSEELVVLFHQERGTPEPPRTFQPMRPIMRRSLIFTPAVLVPVVVLAGIVLFLGYLYYQFTSFAVAPPLEITDPAGDVIVQEATYTLKGRTTPTGTVHVQVGNGEIPVPDVDLLPDGTFTVTISLTPGTANHVIVQVFDKSGKVSLPVSRIITVRPAASPTPPAASIALAEPANGATLTNFVTVSGSYDRTVTSLSVGGVTLRANAARQFRLQLTLPAGPQTIHVVARTASGTTVEETRTVTVRFDSAVVNVAITGGDAWLLATVDGKDVDGTGRVFKEGEVAQFTGAEVRLRTGNGAATIVSYNGQPASPLGSAGTVVDKVYRAP